MLGTQPEIRRYNLRLDKKVRFFMVWWSTCYMGFNERMFSPELRNLFEKLKISNLCVRIVFRTRGLELYGPSYCPVSTKDMHRRPISCRPTSDMAYMGGSANSSTYARALPRVYFSAVHSPFARNALQIARSYLVHQLFDDTVFNAPTNQICPIHVVAREAAESSPNVPGSAGTEHVRYVKD